MQQQQRGGVSWMCAWCRQRTSCPITCCCCPLCAAAALHASLQLPLRCSSSTALSNVQVCCSTQCPVLSSNFAPSKVYTVQQQWGPGLSASEVGNGQIAAWGATQIHAHSFQIQLKYMLGPTSIQMHAQTEYNWFSPNITLILNHLTKGRLCPPKWMNL